MSDSRNNNCSMNNQGKRSLLVLTTSFPHEFINKSGGGGFVYDLSKRLSKNFKVTILTPYVINSKTYEIQGELKIYRFKFLLFTKHELFKHGFAQTLKEKKWKFIFVPIFILAFIYNSWRLIHREKIDLIHAHWIIPQGIIAVIAAKLSIYKPEIFITAHGSDLNTYSSKGAQLLKRFAMKHAKKVTVVSKPLQDLANRILPETIKPIIPMGVDTQLFSYAERNINKHEIVYVGRLSKEKGVINILNALSLVIAEISDVQLQIVGDGVQRSFLEALTKELGLSEHVFFHGFVSNDQLPRLYQEAQLVVMPSESEGAPVVLAEAMCAGSMVLTSDIPVFNQEIINGVNGFSTDVCDSTIFAKAILDVLKLEETQNRTIRKNGAIDFKKRFSWETIIQEFTKQFNNQI